jgi:hypothetical protein
VANALKTAHQEVQENIKSAPVRNSDETGFYYRHHLTWMFAMLLADSIPTGTSSGSFPLLTVPPLRGRESEARPRSPRQATIFL